MHLKWQVLKRQMDECPRKRVCIYFFGVKQGITVIVQWTLEVTHANKLQVLSRMGLLASVFNPFWAYFDFCLSTN